MVAGQSDIKREINSYFNSTVRITASREQVAYDHIDLCYCLKCYLVFFHITYKGGRERERENF